MPRAPVLAQPGNMVGDLAPGRPGHLGYPVVQPIRDLLLRRLREPGGLGLNRARRLLRRRTVGHAAPELLELLIALAARSRAEDETDGQAGGAGDSIPVHLDLSRASHTARRRLPRCAGHPALR